MLSKSTELRNICTANRIRALGLLLSVGGAIAVVDGLVFGHEKPIRGIITFLSGVASLSVRVYLWRTANLRLATLAASISTGVVFLGNYVLYGDPYYMAIGFSVPITASLFLNARDATWVLGTYGFCGVLIALLLHRGFLERHYAPESLLIRTITVIAITITINTERH